MTIRDELDIAAPVDTVWALTVDIESWPSITPTMTSVRRLDDGPLRVGSRASVVQPRQGPRIWTVTRLEPGRLFEWEAGVVGHTMVARHELEPAASGCRNVLSVDVRGWAGGLLERLLGRPVAGAIATENRSFKERAEAGWVSYSG